jgi:cardiolipin synthase
MAIRAVPLRSACLAAALSSAAWMGLVACSGPADSSDNGSADLSDDKAKKDAGKDAAPDAGKDAAADAGKDGSSGDASPPSSGALTLLTEPDDGFTAIYALVSSAKSTIDLTMYELEDTTMTTALTTAAKNGVTVRVILDQNEEKSNNTSAYTKLTAGGVSVHWANPTYTVTHQKTLTIDGTTSAIMTLNLTSGYYSTTRDFAVITSDANDVAAIETTFAADFTNASVTPPTGDDLVWSPTNSQTSLVDIIAGAKDTLLVENEEMEYATIVDALTAAAKRGVDVEVIMTASSSYTSEFKELLAAGVKLSTYASTASLYIHAKVIVADGTSAFVGSENFSTTSLNKNRELGLITTNATIVSSLGKTLASDYAGATPYVIE